MHLNTTSEIVCEQLDQKIDYYYIETKTSVHTNDSKILKSNAALLDHHSDCHCTYAVFRGCPRFQCVCASDNKMALLNPLRDRL